MRASRKLWINLAACAALSILTAGCSDIGSSVKETFVGKPTPTPDLPDRPPLVMPKSNTSLPVPGETAQTAAAWRPQTAQPQQTASQDAKTSDSGGSSWFSGLFGSSDEKKTQ